MERSGAHLEAISDQHRTEDERKRLDSRKNIKKKKHVFEGFLKVPSIDLGSSWGYFWGHLGGLGAILEASWASWGRLDGVLGRLGVLGNAEERLTMLACV